jgi:hypothetical protein
MVRRRRRTLGDAFWDTTWQGVENAWNPVTQYNNVVDAYDAMVAPSAPPTPPSSFIPGSSYSDYLMNAVTGQPTQSQLDYNADQYTAAAANMANVLTSQGVALPTALQPGVAAAQAAADQSAYAKLIGGTAQQALQQALTGGLSISTCAWIAIAGIFGLIVLTK